MIYWREQYERLHIFTLETEKGKTTAAMGLAIRAAGSDKKVFIIQFLKRRSYRRIKNITSAAEYYHITRKTQYTIYMEYDRRTKERGHCISNTAIKTSHTHAQNSQCDLLILDEIMASYNLDLIDKDMLKEFILNKPEALELVLTGRDPADYMIEAADYVTEMKKNKTSF